MGLPSRVTSTEFLKATIIYDDCDLWSDVGFESIAAKFERSLIVNQKKLRSHELICRFSDCPAETKQLREICHPAFPELWIGHGIFEISRPRENYKKIGCAPPKKYFLLPLFLFSSFFFFKKYFDLYFSRLELMYSDSYWYSDIMLFEILSWTLIVW